MTEKLKLTSERKKNVAEMEPNVSLILCKIILFTQFRLKTGSYEPMKTITKCCYGPNEGFRNKYTKE